MFSKILHANDGSDPAFRAFALALDISKQNTAALHLVCVEEIPYLPEYIEEVREETRVAARRFHSVLQKARGMAEQREVKLQTHLRAGLRTHDWQSGRSTRALGALPCIGGQVISLPATRSIIR